MDEVLRKTSKRTIANYFAWRAILFSMKTQGFSYAYKTEKSRLDACIDKIEDQYVIYLNEIDLTIFSLLKENKSLFIRFSVCHYRLRQFMFKRF